VTLAAAPGALAPRSRVEVRPCWNEIGAQGNATCPELLKFFHCRNCPVYSQAAVQLLDRPLLPEYRHEWTERYARPKQLVAPSWASVLLFRIHADWLALPTQAFQEVAEHRRVHSLPHRRQGLLLGLVNIRGELLVCVSLGRLLGVEPTPAGGRPPRSYDRLLVANWDGNRLVFPADEVHGIHRYQHSELREPPATLTKSSPTYTRGLVLWQGKTAGLLDAERVFAALNRSLT
jgi:chemotaxis-related protein WspD